MARKRLIKGANAVRVEERIARVPEDLASESGIFRTLKALEQGGAGPLPPPLVAASRPVSRPAPREAPPVVSQATPRATPRIASRPASRATQEPKSGAGATARPSTIKAPAPKAPLRRLSSTDFSLSERETIVRCCADYRARLPFYLQAVQREVEVIDSVIGKCRSIGGRGSANTDPVS